MSLRRTWRARTEPSTTGPTISKWDGLNANAKWTSPPGVITLLEKPWWYLTSPEPFLWIDLPSNSPNKSAGFLPIIFTRRFKRPRCGIPITTSLQPTAPARWIISFTIGIKDSPPSTPKRLAPTYLLPRYFSRPSAAVKRSKKPFFWSFV